MQLIVRKKSKQKSWVEAKSLGLAFLFTFFCGCFESEIQQNAPPLPPLLGSWIGSKATATNSYTTGGFYASSSGDGLFSFPLTPAVDSLHGYLYFPDPANNNVIKLKLSTGAFLGALGNATSSSGNCPNIGVPATWCVGGLFAAGAADGMFSSPGGLAIDLSKNYYYISDSQNYRVVKYDLVSGAFVGAVGVSKSTTGTCPSSGMATAWCTGGLFKTSAVDGGFVGQSAIALDIIHNTMYVADTLNHRIELFILTTGAFSGAIGAVTGTTGTCPSSGAAPGWCNGGAFAAGTTDGSLNLPAGLAIDPSAGVLYVADSSNNRVSKFSLNSGAFVGSIGKVTATSGTCPASGPTGGWCTQGTFASGSLDGEFNNPKALAIDSSHAFLFVADSGNHRVQKFNLTSGAFVGSVGYASGTSIGTCPSGSATTVWCTGGVFSAGSQDGRMNNPYGIIVDASNNTVYVGDSGNGRILKYTGTTGAYGGANGGTLTSITGWTHATSTVRPAVEVAAGGGDGALSYPQDTAIDSANGNLLVVDTNNSRIQKFSLSSGAFSGAIGLTNATLGTCPANGVTPTWCTGGAFIAGVGDGMLSGPSSIKIDTKNGVFYVSDSGNHRITKFSLSNGAFVGAIGGVTASTGTCPNSGATLGWCTGGAFASGAGDGMLNNPKGIEIDAVNGVLYVADKGNARVSKFNLSTGAFIGAMGKVTGSTGTCAVSGATSGWCTGGAFVSGATDGTFSSPTGVTLDSANSALYVVDYGNNRVQKFSQATGVFVGAVGKVTSTTGSCPSSGVTSAWCTGGTFLSGSADGMFLNPTYAAVDLKNSYLYISDSGNSRVTQYNLTTGAFIGAIGMLYASSGSCPVSGPTTSWCTGGTFVKGVDDLMFNLPSGLTVDPVTSFLYVTDPNNGRVNLIAR
jgi:DNA-binding beta-propeller fold protein YncE